MGVLEGVDKEVLRDLLGRGWLTHDGMWFYHVSRECGMETANRLNREAIMSLAPIETGRVLRVLGMEGKESWSARELEEFMLQALELILPRSVFTKIRFSHERENVFHWEWEKGQCFAYKGMQMIGAIADYRCGVMFRIECWLRTLGIDYEMQPAIEGCLMYEKGECSGDILIKSDT